MKLSKWMAAGLVCWAAIGQNGTATKDVEWPSYNADTRGSRYRPLDQINASNFSQLEIAWRLKTDNFGNRPEFKLEGTPLMVKGVLYATAGSRRAAIAVDAATGEVMWVHGEREGERGAAAPRQLSGRGLAYWTDGKEERILYTTPGYRLIALDAKTGVPIPSFGKGGAVDLKARSGSNHPARYHHRRDRDSIGARGGERHHHHRRGVSRGNDAEDHAQ
jgi:quinoprotein glucose dehydrogenase